MAKREYHGLISIGTIRNEQVAGTGHDPFIPMKENQARFVHYPDCQQLTIWLSHPGREYGLMRLVNTGTGITLGEWPVVDKLNGSIQLLWDTAFIAPGDYQFEINWKDRYQHIIPFTKHKKGKKIQAEPVVSPVKEKSQTELPKVYRDGTGAPIPNEDLILREKADQDIVNKFTRRLVYEGNGRAGTVIYIEGETRLRFWNEMGGGNCMVYIDIPGEKEWEAITKLPLNRRKDIIDFIARRVQAEQASNCRYEIGENAITYYYK